MESVLKTTHNLPFESAEWNHPANASNKIKWMLFRIGTCEGQWRCNDGFYQILSIVNSQQGNGHLDDVFEWFEFAAKRDGKILAVLDVINPRFAKHLVEKRGFKAVHDTGHYIKIIE